ncbi:MAG TPA: FCD domain-containing protein [Baekduia sp.]|uniref:FadR/GntR family transcriptional regulator n=1 Tax=Baekduia sp. TaxID=2600305 RepID=UPI002C13E466|nr:FCD domain-containing protein [Baekduia sp.]HMJ37861.1 FCD domain-containing protein [Baekduia sp.]
MAELVADRLRRRIITGELDDGASLPREAQMISEFGVSRPSLREAIRILETEGLIRIRRGKVGGAVVMRPTAHSAAYHLGLTLQSHATTLDDLAAARSVLEPACAALAAALPDRARKKVVARLTELIDENEAQLGAATDFTSGALAFHAAIVELCGNTTITLLAGALESVWASQERLWAEKAVDDGDYPDAASQRQVVRAHRRIAKLIESGDVDVVTRAMRDHLNKSQPYVNYDAVPIEVVS